jgi:hypothetical protein
MSQGAVEAPSSRIGTKPQRDDLTTNRQGPEAITNYKVISHMLAQSGHPHPGPRFLPMALTSARYFLLESGLFRNSILPTQSPQAFLALRHQVTYHGPHGDMQYFARRALGISVSNALSKAFVHKSVAVPHALFQAISKIRRLRVLIFLVRNAGAETLKS